MTSLPIRFALRRPLKQIRHIRAVPPQRATGLVKAVYTQLEHDFGMLAPPVALHSPAPRVLAASWAMLRESLVATGAASRADKEVVAAAVSQANTCPYCVEVHGMALRTLGRGDDADAIGDDRAADIADSSTKALAAWAVGEANGPPLSSQEIAELIGVAVTFHYLNRMVNVFLGPSPLPDFVPGSARDTVRALLGKVLKPRDCAPGDSLDLMPAADLPADLVWAAGNATVAAAFARAARAMEDNRVVTPGVRKVVSRALDDWGGSPPGMSQSWSHEAVSVLPEAERPPARLALLTALSSFQVDEQAVADLRGEHGDAAVVELVGWASLAAAREWGTRLAASAAVRTTTRRTDA